MQEDGKETKGGLRIGFQWFCTAEICLKPLFTVCNKLGKQI